MKSIKILNKRIPILAVLMAVIVLGIASAALVTTFVQHDTEVDVTAPLYLDTDIEMVDLVAGETYEFVAMTVNSNASVPTMVELNTEILEDGEGIGYHYTFDGKTLGDIDGDGLPDLLVPAMSGGETLLMKLCTSPALVPTDYVIETHFTPADGLGMLVLDDKDGDWNEVDNDAIATLIFGTSQEEFVYYLVGEVPLNDTEYSLVYYADELYDATDVLPEGKSIGDDKWGGVNGEAGTVIATAFSADDHSIEMEGSINLGMDLPHPDDANFNMDETDYREAPDFYCNGDGAKLWLVVTSDLTSGDLPMTGWNPGNYLFETDLIHYEDTSPVPQ